MRGCRPIVLPVTLALLTWSTPGTAHAEGMAQTGATHELESTELFVDVVDHTTETVDWTGTGSIDVYDPDGDFFATVASGSSFDPDMEGAWRLELSSVQGNGSGWDVTVNGADPDYGRLWAYTWDFNAGDYVETLSGSFYAMVSTGAHDTVVELKPEGLAGFEFSIVANSTGIDGANGRSISGLGTFAAEYRMYLNPPEVSRYDMPSPDISATSFGAGPKDCNQVANGALTGTFEFDSDLQGTGHVVCDLNGDGDFDLTSGADLHLVASVDVGTNQIPWDGTDNDGNLLAHGDYDCQAMVTVGEFHYVGWDIESSYEGLRFFELDADLNRTGLPAYWNDEDVQDLAVTMDNGDVGAETSGVDGLDPGLYTDAATPHGETTAGNARAWGDFTGATKGNETLLDTYTWVASDASASLSVRVVDPLLDSDGDSLADLDETCVHGTDPGEADSDGDGLLDDVEVYDLPTSPTSADSDGDGVPDDVELGSVGSPLDTDGDGIIDAVDPDDDGDGVSTVDEDVDGDGDPRNDDADGDTVPDYLDDDDDDDGVPTLDEDADGDGDPTNDDSDGDALPDYLDDDDDDDGIPSSTEGTDDSDDDGIPDHLDPDDDDDGVPSSQEGTGDTDGDSIPDYLDDDDDGDGIPTLEEGDGDTDWDGIPDYLDDDDDGDGIPTADESGDTDGDGIPDHLDPDDDNDGIRTEIEGTDDSDGDGIPNHHDTDSDDDGIADGIEGADDVDGDGLPNFEDDDSDGDGRSDSDEGTTDSDGDGVIDAADPDDDDDGILSIEEGWDDTDDDGVADALDLDSDDDGVGDADESADDTDGDGIPDFQDTDDDGDGIPTSVEAGVDDADVDGDGIPNWRDVDSDGDGLSDADEGTVDADGNGLMDFVDPKVDLIYLGGCASVPAPASGWLVLMGLGLVGSRRRVRGRW